MALSAEQQSQLELQNATEATRHSNSLVLQAKLAKLEAVRLAKETLIENDRNKPVGERGVSAADITTFAQAIDQYVNQ
jgi:hypothetical protein